MGLLFDKRDYVTFWELVVMTVVIAAIIMYAWNNPWELAKIVGCLMLVVLAVFGIAAGFAWLRPSPSNTSPGAH